ncbi:hypothetical protein QJS04_geneDACA020537 [Acorus gramineus]|uniref:Response regulatory domain-containing protein n=1 Tax=Acorus gramineus TaxID=55184 RepID=A0AAV9AB67_ACOGR|nr:hypothetical protein QJS04_geneDACA020537 [Acorus gramineus]
MAVGNSARLMVEACSGAAGPTTLALVAAARQTGGRASITALGEEAVNVEFVTAGDDAAGLLMGKYARADFVIVDCKMEGREARVGGRARGACADRGRVQRVL